MPSSPGRARRLAFPLLVALLAACGGVEAQFEPSLVLVEGEPAPGLATPITGLGRPICNGSGLLVVEGSHAAPLPEDFIWRDGALLVTSGMPLAGAGGTLGTIHPFESPRSIDAIGRVSWCGDLQGVPAAVDEILARDTTVLLREGDPSPIAGRIVQSFSSVSIDDAGCVYFELDLDGPTAGDELLARHDGTSATPLAMNAVSLFREGDSIVGGPLDGHVWDNGAFLDLRINGSGSLLVEGDLETTGIGTASSLDNEVLVRKRPGIDYEVLLREGVTLLPTPIAGTRPFRSIHEIDLADNDDWIVRGTISGVGPEFDDVAIAGLGGSGATVIAQEGMDISAVVGIPDAELGAIQGVRVDGTERVLLLANALSPTGPLPFDEVLLLLEGGSWTLVTSDEVPLPSGALIVDLITDHLALADGGDLFAGARVAIGGIQRDGVLRFVEPPVLPLEGLVCSQRTGAPVVEASWINPPAAGYDGIVVLVDGTVVATLPGGETSFQSPPVTPLDRPVEVQLIPFIGGDQAAPAGCSPFVLSPPDLVECAAPLLPIPDLGVSTSTISIGAASTIRDLAVEIAIDHGRHADLRLSLSSPGGVTIDLLSGVAGSGTLRTIFADFGAPAGTGTLGPGTVVAPVGPGTLGELRCTGIQGDWTLTAEDLAPGFSGLLEEWCLRVREETAPALNCCPLPTEPIAASGGSCLGGAALLSFSAAGPLDLIEWERIDSGGGVTVIAVPPGATTVIDGGVANGETYTYRLRARCAPGGLLQDVGETTLTVDAGSIPPIVAASATPDPCAGVVLLDWDLRGVPYAGVELQRDGATIADVTGLSTFTDLTPPAGVIEYALVATCGSTSASTAVSTTLLLEAPALEADSDPLACDAMILITWTNPRSYDSLDLWIDGAPASAILPLDAGDSGSHALLLGPLVPGPHTFDLSAQCGVASSEAWCAGSAWVPWSGETDLVLALEGTRSDGDPGAIDSATRLRDALADQGVSVLLGAPVRDGDLLTGLPCALSLIDFERLWLCAGTYPTDYRLSGAEGDLLATLNRDAGVALYLESGDHWGFQPVASALDLRDGIEPPLSSGGTGDGNDTLTALDADTGGAGITPQALFPTPLPYAQDRPSGSDRNDQLSPSGTTLGLPVDPEVGSVHVLWRNAPDGLPDPNAATESDPWITGVLAIPVIGAPLIAQSWEFGGFGLDPGDPAASAGLRGQLAGLYLSALGGVVGNSPLLIRGDANDDGIVNIADAIHLLLHLFPGASGGTPIVCRDAADANDDGGLNISDAVVLLNSLFGAGPLPPPNSDSGCGVDPTPALGCAGGTACP